MGHKSSAFPASIAPGVSAPAGLGVSPLWVIQLIEWLASVKSQYQFDWPLMDIAEMNPQFDPNGIQGYELIMLFFIHSQY